MRKSTVRGADLKKTASIIILCFFLFTVLSCGLGHVDAAPSPFTGDIRITADGTVEGTDKISRNENVYTLIGDISGTVENGLIFVTIEKDGVIFDGDGRTIQGTGTGIAIAVYGRKDVTKKNTKIIDFGTGIELRVTDFESNSTASNNRILDNYLETTYWAINLNTNNGVVSGNKIVSKNSIYGVNFQSNNTVFSNNAFVDGGLIVFEPCFLNDFSGNTINSKPIVYLERQKDQVIDGAGQVFLTDCCNMTVRNVEASLNLRVTIELFGKSNTRIANCKGNLVLRNSHSNTILGNPLIDVGSPATFDSSAVALSDSHNNTIADNSIVATGSYGVTLAGASYNKVYGNNTSSTGQPAIKIESKPDL